MLKETLIQSTIRLKNQQEAIQLFGENDKTLKRIRTLSSAKIIARGDTITISGDTEQVQQTENFIRDLLAIIRQGGQIEDTLERANELSGQGKSLSQETTVSGDLVLPNKLRPKTPNQARYLEAINQSDIVFGIGPAGTGKTYLAVAMAVAALKARKVKRIILTRPAVEAGERLGFLPGDLQAKIDPYLRPLYDALYDMLDSDRFESYLQSGVIEVAPLAFMRGRAQPLTSKVLTVTGWKEMGSLQVGDHVVGSNGKATQILGVYPQGKKPVYRITMTDGSSTLCCAEHLWTVYTASDKRRSKAPRTLETQQMISNLKTAHQHRFELPLLSAPVHHPAKEVPLDPYALGLLLGDGCITTSTTPAFSSQDTELVLALEQALEPLAVALVHKGRVDYTLKHTAASRGGLRIPNPVTLKLRELGLAGTTSGSKFIPEVYLHNSAEVRLAVLQGLLDTDGTACVQKNRTCRVQYTTTSEKLKDDVVYLVRSLGGVAHHRVRKAEGRPPGFANGRSVPYRADAHVLDIRLPAGMQPFRLTRKAELYQSTAHGRPMRYIKSIEPAGETETQCIRVAAQDHLYITEDFIVTHNTLNDAFIILDEAQNTTPEQMKMFLTRMGFSSKVVVTGDVTQVDLPRNVKSGLAVARKTLENIEGIHFHHFAESDVVRHPLVGKIVRAYEVAEDEAQAIREQKAAERAASPQVSATETFGE